MGCSTSKAVNFDQMQAVNASLTEGRAALMDAKLELRKTYNRQRRELDKLIRQRETAFKMVEQMKSIDSKKIMDKSSMDARIAHLTRVIANADEMIAFSEKELSAQQAVINKLPMTW